MTGQHRVAHAAPRNTGGRHRSRQRPTEAYVWLGAGAIALGVGAALTGGSGVAQADTTGSVASGPQVSNNSAPTTKIRTVLSAQTVTSSSSTTELSTAKPQSFVSDKQSVVRQLNPADTGDNNNSDAGDGSLANTLLGLGGDNIGLGSSLPGNVPSIPSIPFIELGGGGGGLLSQIAHALGGGLL